MASTERGMLLLDIEGTTTPITFVLDVLFPYASERYDSYIRANWDDPSFATIKNTFTAEDPDLTTSPDSLIAFVRAKHAANEKHTAFKNMQGGMWKTGFEEGVLKSSVYPDVVDAIKTVGERGVDTCIYSSGSVEAQKLLFGHVEGYGDVTPLIKDYFDTSNAGAKLDAGSYKRIAKMAGRDVGSCLFLSDNPKEVAAAKEAAMPAWIVVRQGNEPISDEDRSTNTVVHDFTSVPEHFASR